MITYDMPQSGSIEQDLWQTGNKLSVWDMAKLGASHSFERMTTVGNVLEERSIAEAEREAGTFYKRNPEAERQLDTFGGVPPVHPHAMTEDEYKKSPYYRLGIDYSINMTEQRAKILADTFDRRKHESGLLDKSADTIGKKAVLFGASFLGNLPDPINFIPFVGGAAKGASIGTKFLRGAAEGIVSTAATDAFIFPLVNAKGEGLGFYDLAMDLTFGAVIGGGMGALGGKLYEHRKKTFLEKYTPEQQSLVQELTGSGLSAADAQRIAKDTFTNLADSPHRTELAEALRSRIGGDERMGFARTMEKALIDVSHGESANIGAAVEGLGIQDNYERAVAESTSRRTSVAERDKEDVFGERFGDFSGRLPEGIEHLLQEKRGFVQVTIGKDTPILVDIPYGKDGNGGYGLSHIIERRTEQGIDGVAFVRGLPNLLENGSFYVKENQPNVKFVVHEGNKAVIRLDFDGESRTWLVSAYEEFTSKRSKAKAERLTLNPAYGSGPTSPLHLTSGEKIVPESSSHVNTQATPNPDKFAAPQRAIPFSPPDMDTLQKEADFLSSTEGLALEELSADRIRKEGKISAEDLQILDDLKNNAAKLDNMENASLGILQCVTGALDG